MKKKIFIAGNSGAVRNERTIIKRGVRRRLLALPEKSMIESYWPVYEALKEKKA